MQSKLGTAFHSAQTISMHSFPESHAGGDDKPKVWATSAGCLSADTVSVFLSFLLSSASCWAQKKEAHPLSTVFRTAVKSTQDLCSCQSVASPLKVDPCSTRVGPVANSTLARLLSLYNVSRQHHSQLIREREWCVAGSVGRARALLQLRPQKGIYYNHYQELSSRRAAGVARRGETRQGARPYRPESLVEVKRRAF